LGQQDLERITVVNMEDYTVCVEKPQDFIVRIISTTYLMKPKLIFFEQWQRQLILWKESWLLRGLVLWVFFLSLFSWVYPNFCVT
jgi:hypothetical protein